MARIDSYRERMMAATRAARADERELKNRIAKLYERAAEDMAETAGRAAPGGLTEARAEALTKSLRARSKELWRGVQELTEAGMNKAAGRSVAAQTDFLQEIGQSIGLDIKPALARVFGSTADDAVAHVLRGGIYGGKAPALSKRIWNNEALQGGQIEQLIAQAVAKGESPIQLARALEAYVSPKIIQPDNWNDVYDIPFTYKVDYNAKRLAVTSIRHAAWGATITAARDNPFADYFHWELTPAHVIFDICDAHAAHDEGLGEGNFAVDAAPLPHPWCTCLYYIDTDKSLEEIGRELRGWLDGGENERLDEAFARRESEKLDIRGGHDILSTKALRAERAAKNARKIIDSSGEIYELVRGKRLQDKEVFAGYGSKTPLSEFVSEGLSEQVGGSPEKWAHVKAKGWINYHGEAVRAEIHWFEQEGVGAFKHKIKRWLDSE